MEKFNFQITYEKEFDEVTNCWVLWNEKYNLSAYGATVEKALEMLNVIVDDILTWKNEDSEVEPEMN